MSHAPLPIAGTYPSHPASLPDAVIRDGPYELAFVRTIEALDDLLRLRFSVFNLEMNEGLYSAYDSGMDRDAFDDCCHHIVVRHVESRRAVGTYRLQTVDMARKGLGHYSAQEFDFSSVPEDVIDQSVEIGRACIERDHRSLKVLYLLWRGLGAYANWNGARYLFGCCSLTSQDTDEGRRVYAHLESRGQVQQGFSVNPLPGLDCGTGPGAPGPVRIPRLMRVYLALGARICGPPAIDRAFRTIDYLTLIDLDSLDKRRMAFFGLER